MQTRIMKFSVILILSLNSCNNKENRENTIVSGEAKIFTESFGDTENPAILLLGGATVSMLFYDEEFCQRLADKGYFVIRYDNRDVGKSTWYPPGPPPYDLNDMVDDGIAILDGYKLQNAHFVGVSLGGLLAQMAALKAPERVKSLTLIGSGPFGQSDSNIPAMDKRVLDFQAKAGTINWAVEDSVVKYLLESAKLMSGSKEFDRKRGEKFIRQEFRRAGNYISRFNHASLQGGEEFYDRLNEISQPVLIIHGTEDRIWHYKHTEVLKRELKKSKLVTLKGTGHELHFEDWNTIIMEISNHVKLNN